MKTVLKTLGLMILSLGLYIGATSLLSFLICLLFGVAFDFFVSLFVWFFIPFGILCALMCYEGGKDDGRKLEDDWRL